MRILHAWEIGDKQGHARNLTGLARSAALLGYDHMFAASFPAALRELGVNVMQAPAVDPIDIRKYLKPGQPWQARSFADILTVMGYAHRRVLQRRLDAWREVIDRARPDIVLAESAPTAILAARGVCPVVAVGTPYGLPPTCAERFPVFEPEGTALLPDDAIADVVNRVAGTSGALPSSFRAEAVIPFCYSGMDMYQAHRQADGVGPLRSFSPMGLSDPATFAYLSGSHPQIAAILEALEHMPEPSRVYVDGKPYGLKSFDLGQELATCTRVVHHGSMGMAQAALGAGRAQFVFPYHSENMQNCRKLFEHGVALGAGYAEHDRYASMLACAYDDRLFRAQEVAKTLPAATPAKTVAAYLR